MGQSPPSSTVNQDGYGMPFVQGNAEFGNRSPRAVRYCSKPKKQARQGDILLSVRAPVGALNLADRSLCIGRGLSAITATGVEAEFLWHALHQSVADLSRVSQGSTFAAISKADLAGLEVPLPSPGEQRKIAAILSSVDDAIGKTQEVIEQVQVVKRGLMHELLTRGLPGRDTQFKQTEIGEIPMGWKCVNLGSLVIAHNSGIYKKAALYGNGYNIVGVGDLYGCHSIDGQKFRFVPLEPAELGRYTLNEGDLVYGESSLVREGIARTLPVTRRGAGTAFAWHTRRLRLDAERANAVFFHYVLGGGPTRKRVMAVATQTALTGITTKDFFSVPVPLPAMEEQRRISAVLASHDEYMGPLQRRT